MAVTKAQLQQENDQLRVVAEDLLDILRNPARYGLTISTTPDRGPAMGTRLVLEAMFRRARAVINREAAPAAKSHLPADNATTGATAVNRASRQ